MSRELPHPIQYKDGLPTDIETLEELRNSDPTWHFRLAVRTPYEVVAQQENATPSLGEPKRLLHVKRARPRCDIQVVGHFVDREIDPHHFLEDLLEAQERRVVSHNPMPMNNGIIGDMVAEWDTDGMPYAGRFFASKWGPRIFVVSVQAARDDYALVADDFFDTIGSFEVVDESLGDYAELFFPIELDVPTRWKTFVPDSYRVQLSPPEEVVAGFVAANLRGGELTQVDGMLSMGVALRKVAKKPRKAARMFLDAVKYNKIALDHQDFIDEPTDKPFKRTWICVTDCAMGDAPGEMRCRVMMSKRYWVVAGLIGPRRSDDPVSWRENKRALDIATSKLELDI